MHAEAPELLFRRLWVNCILYFLLKLRLLCHDVNGLLMLNLLSDSCAFDFSLNCVALLLQELFHVILLEDVDWKASCFEQFLHLDSSIFVVDKQFRRNR